MSIRWASPVMFWLLGLLPLFFAVWYQQGDRRLRAWIVLLLRLSICALLVLFLAGPEIASLSPQLVVFIADRSDSVRQESEMESWLQTALQTMDDEDLAAIVVFGEQAVVQSMPQSQLDFSGFTRSPARAGTNIEQAIQLGSSLFSDTDGGRMVLLSDGWQTQGDALSAARTSPVPIDVVSFPPPVEPEVLVDSLRAPVSVQHEAEFSLHALIRSNTSVTAQVSLWQAEQRVDQRSVSLQPGANVVRFAHRLQQAGAYTYRVEVESAADTILANNWAESVVLVSGPPGLLVITQDDAMGRQFAALLQGEGFSVDLGSVDQLPSSPAGLHGYSAVILDDVDGALLSAGQMQALHRYVQDFGGGLVAVGGPSSFGMGVNPESQLELLLPVFSQLEHRLRFPTLSLLIVLDKSGSMAEVQPGERGATKMDLAKEASAALLDVLVREERIGVLTFDTVPRQAVPLQEAGNREQIMAQLGRIQPGGGTEIYPALRQAYQLMLEETTAVRHVVLISDGISEDGDFQDISESMVAAGITLSTVGVGADLDRELLQQLAHWGGGRSYFTASMETVYQILMTETTQVLHPAAIQEQFVPQITAQAPLLDGIDWQQAPPLTGYVVTSSRDLADVYLVTADNSPLLASWRYGLGRTVALTTDLGRQWATAWRDWPQLGQFWRQVVQWVERDLQSTEEQLWLTVEGDQGKLDIVVDAVDGAGALLNFLSLEAVVHAPDGSQESVRLAQTGPGRYQAQVAATRAGSYLVSVTNAAQLQQEPVVAGFVQPYSLEYRVLPPPLDVLPQVAEASGGRQVSSEAISFDYPMDPVYTDFQDIGRQFLLLALALFLLDAAVRLLHMYTLRSVFGALGQKPIDPAAEEKAVAEIERQRRRRLH